MNKTTFLSDGDLAALDRVEQRDNGASRRRRRARP